VNGYGLYAAYFIPNSLDPSGLAKLDGPTGAAAIRAGLEPLKAKCGTCCDPTDVPKCCTSDECKAETEQIISALEKAWTNAFGKGASTDKDSIGGYMCWDWANIFDNALKNLNPKCVSFKQGAGYGKQTTKDGKVFTPFHFFLRVWACKEEYDGCRVNFDDGWMIEGKSAHEDDYLPEPWEEIEPSVLSQPPYNWKPPYQPLPMMPEASK